MGRRAKAFTHIENIEQARQKQRERRNTPYGRELIKAQRYKSYHRVHGRQGSSTPYLPQLLLTQAMIPLPETSPLFCQAVRSTQLLDETGLDIWDTGPPYATGPPSNSPRELIHTKRLVEVMHGRRARMQKEHEIEVALMSKEALWDRCQSAVAMWKATMVFLEEYKDGHRELTMAQLWVEWLAREAYDYYSRHML
ncbi:hypothetical protein BDZ94DRAFT_1325816 [Collybia nuda]|uniref:Uncharacterized protein n=1 Tax=Collybia nuda TaxID=64659 RepID=A0A9P5XWM7_9AGAR|nr:hypothetical protein BDZ94DRAFT_1325816 [Collybia nuda]